MRHDYGTVKIVTANAAVQVSTSPLRVKAIIFKARPTNGANVWFGVTAAVSSASGYELPASATLEFDRNDYGEHGSMEISSFWFNAASTGQQVDWVGTFEH